MPQDILGLAASLGFIDELYEAYLEDPAAIDPSWVSLLGGRPAGNGAGRNGQAARQALGTSPRAMHPPNSHAAGVPNSFLPDRLVRSFRTLGHLEASLDPLELQDVPAVPELTHAFWGLDQDAPVVTDVRGFGGRTVGALVEYLRKIYCGAVGIEFMHISDPNKRSFLIERLETRFLPLGNEQAPRVLPATRANMLRLLVNAEGFERFCHVKYPGTKRFSLEGSESLIPLMDLVVAHAQKSGAKEAVIGMAHRGRLTALEQILRRPARDIFSEFEDVEPEASLGGGDVKYHLGYSTDRTDEDGNSIHLSLSFNPSHLEAIDPVVLGRVRAKQARAKDGEHRAVVGILVHGDAAFAGQGLVAECLNLMSLPGYRTGGTVHIIVNNQVGFTASPQEARSTPYCTDIAKMVDAPVWHVNGEDLDEVARVVEMAMAYRERFQSDVVIDMYCYRKYGHNEMDEPGFTQPVMYDRIQKKRSVVEQYAQRVVDSGELSQAEVEAMIATRQRDLEAELAAGKSQRKRPRTQAMAGAWQGFTGGNLLSDFDVDTGADQALLTEIATRMVALPEGFVPHPKLVRLLEQRLQMGRGERPLDWGMAELLAYGSLVWNGTSVRLSGQDCVRGTFSHRHAYLTDVRTGVEINTFGRLRDGQGSFEVLDSPLSEAGVLGFEFGYSLDCPDALVMWEAQFGDFVNGAQVMIDQFIVASEDKWNRLSGIVLLLPHGYEGQGPEHSSARLERFLQSCAEDNIQVAQPTTPAQMFHLLRRQVLRPWRKPLVVMTPKSLLRLPAATSTLSELTTGRYQNVIVTPPEGKTCDSVLLCSGKIYYELLEERKKRGAQGVALVRLEQLYPWPERELTAALAGLGKPKHVRWVQDEPLNMGAAFFTGPRLKALLTALRWDKAEFQVVARDESASPATGSHRAHVMEQGRLMAAAFAM